MTDTRLLAFIPARWNSKRIPHKNIRPFRGHPLLAYAIQGALDADLFAGIYVSSDSDEVLRIAEHYGASSIKRPPQFATDTSPDAEWISHALATVGTACEQYAILRPTNPFRSGAMIRLAYQLWDRRSHMKAVEPVQQHPGKMWVMEDDGANRRMFPLWDGSGHLNQTNTLRTVYVQNAALEFRTRAWDGTYQPFIFPEAHGAFDLNTEDDWILAEALVEHGLACPPRIERGAYV